MFPKSCQIGVFIASKYSEGCNIPRYQDRVSQEVTQAFRVARSFRRKVLLSLIVRFKQCPRGLAMAMAKCHKEPDAIKVAPKFKRGKCYRQTGIVDSQLLSGVESAVTKVCAQARYLKWEELESVIAQTMKSACNGTKLEHFASRQSAADLCKIKGFVGDLTPQRCPKTSKLGPGAEVGYWHSQKAMGYRKVSIPKRLPYLDQSGYCEYHKLICRWNFPHLKQKARYIPHDVFSGSRNRSLKRVK